MDFRGKVDVDGVLNSAAIEAIVRKETEEVAARARSYAAVDSGELKASITARTEKNSGAMRDRVVGVVSTNATAGDGSGYGSEEEFGSSRGRGNFFLRRALTG